MKVRVLYILTSNDDACNWFEEVESKKIIGYFHNLDWHSHGLGPQVDNARAATLCHQSIIQVESQIDLINVTESTKFLDRLTKVCWIELKEP